MMDAKKDDSSRRQLTLFVSPSNARIIEEIRRQFNPVQFSLIAAHLTLCREDELPEMTSLLEKLNEFNEGKIHVDFGPPQRFADGKGLFLPGNGQNKAFQQLREAVLGQFGGVTRIHHPHITLIHPRNGTCTDEIFDLIKGYALPRRLVFERVTLIEQHDGGVWQQLHEWSLK